MKKMIVRLAEGLGNQLFMYANAFSLSKKNNYDLYIDDESGFFKDKDICKYQLDNFNINSSICNQSLKFNNHIKNLKRKLLIKTDFFKKKKMFLIEKQDKFKNTSFHNFYHKTFADLLYVEGHYETELYFDDLKDELKNQFSFRNNYLFKNNKYLNLIQNNPSVVSICIRQNRYSERKKNKFDYDQITKSENLTKNTIDYIYRATEFVEKKIDKPIYLLWSNDFNNLRSYFPESKFVFVENFNNKTLVDFYLLLKCKNFIVGPTTFHWWPAWLNNDDNSIILRPKNINNSNNSDFWPKKWISI